jgi:transcription initiation factor TFIID TATA-box-binding protein
MRFAIRNIILTVKFADRLDIDLVSRRLKGVEYEPETFPGLIYRMQRPKASFLIFSSGTMNCAGVASHEEAEKAIRNMLRELKRIGVKVYRPRIEVQNIVASADLRAPLDLNRIAFNLAGCEYEPEQFPGLVLRLDKPRVVFLLFASGRIICVGGRSVKDVGAAIRQLTKDLRRIGVLKQR